MFFLFFVSNFTIVIFKGSHFFKKNECEPEKNHIFIKYSTKNCVVEKKNTTFVLRFTRNSGLGVLKRTKTKLKILTNERKILKLT